MVPKYYVVLFKNKIRKKIIKKFSNFDNAKNFYEQELKENQNILFERKVENGKPSEYEIAFVRNRVDVNSEVYLKDDLGRNIKVTLEDEEFEIMRINKFKIEELIYDTQKNKKISTPDLIKTYLKGEGMKMISSLNNKFVIQKDEEVKLFSLKSPEECARFLETLTQHFYSIKRKDCLFIKDVSTPQKKYLYKTLEEMGIDKKILYRQFTTYPR